MVIYFRACEKQQSISYVTRYNNIDKSIILKKCWLSIQKSIKNSDRIIVIEDGLSNSTLDFLQKTCTNTLEVVSVPEHEWNYHQHTVTLIECLEHNCKLYPDEIHYIVEDDYLHTNNAVKVLNETITNWKGFAVSYDYPDRYRDPKPTKILLGPDRHWRMIDSSTMTVMAKGQTWLRFMDILKQAAPTSNDKVFEEIYQQVACLSPIPSLSAHMTDAHLSPFINWGDIWDNLDINI